MRIALQFLSLLWLLAGASCLTVGACNLARSVSPRAELGEARAASGQREPTDEGDGMLGVMGATSTLTGVVFLLLGYGLRVVTRDERAP